MFHTLASKYRLLSWTLGLTYIATGIIGTLPGASLIQLARNTSVSLEVAGGMFTASALGFVLGAILTGVLTASVKPKYLLALGLLLLGSSSLVIALTHSFPLLLVGQTVKGVGFGFIDIALNTIAALAFKGNLNEKLNTIHGMFGVGALLGPTILALGLQFFNYLPLAYMVGTGIAAIAIVLILKQEVPTAPRIIKGTAQEQTPHAVARYKILRQGLLWLMILQISLYTCAEIGFGDWIVTAVSQSAALSLALAAPVATAFYMGLTIGRLGGAQLLKHGWMSETRLLYLAVFGSVLSGGLVAIFPGQLAIAYSASMLVGCFYGPLFPSIMAITSRRFVHAIGPVSSLMMIGTGATSTLVPAAMGLLIPIIGINWVIAIPSICCLAVVVPMALANRRPQIGLQLSGEQPTMTVSAEVP